MGDIVKGIAGGFESAIKGIGGSIPGIKDLWGQENAEDMMNAQMAQQGANREWSEYMSNTAHRREMADLQAAGLNPMLSALGKGASTPGAPGVPSGTAYGSGKTLGESAASASQVQIQDAQTGLVKAETRESEAREAEIRARTPIHAQTLINLKQQVEESIAQIGYIRQQTETSHATAANVQQQTANLRESIAQIKATVVQLGSLAALNYQQITALSSQIGKTHAETAEIIQRTRANLPELQRQIANLEVIFKRYAETGHRISKEHQDGVLGAIDRVMRALRGNLQPQ